MVLHPQVFRFLKQQAGLCSQPIDRCTPHEFRQRLVESLVAASPVEPIEAVATHSASGPLGPIPVRCYRPTIRGISPALVYFHGGGWVGGDLETHDDVCRAIANAAKCVVIAVDYRLAPEHKFPAAVEDAYAATCWVRQHAADLAIDRSRIAVGGDSAGGNLAAAVSLMARDRRQPPPCLQVLLYPILDFDMATDSYLKCAEGYGLTRAAMNWFRDCYLAHAEDAKNAYAAPMQAKDVQHLPSALILTAEYDVLRDEGDGYASRLRAAGISTEHTCYAGMIHGFIPRWKQFDAAQVAIRQIADALKRAFAAAN